MSISVTVNGNPVNVNKGKITNSEIGGVKTKEFQRRRKLRLLQVREQSKDIAKKLRDRVSKENLNVLSDLDKAKKNAFAAEQDQVVKELEKRCKSGYENFGAAHASAAEEIAELEANRPAPDKSTERGNSAKARLQRTRKQSLEEQKTQLERKLLARNIANERSRQNFTSSLKQKSQPSTSGIDIEEEEEEEISNTNLDVTINSGADGSVSIHRRISQPTNKQNSQTRTPSVTIVDDSGPSTSKRYMETAKGDIETSKGFTETSRRDIETQCDVEFTIPEGPLQTSSKISITEVESNPAAAKRKGLKPTQKILCATSSKNSESRDIGASRKDGESTQKNGLLPTIEETKSGDNLSSKSLGSKSSLSFVSRFIHDRDKRLPENRSGFHKVTDSDMEKIKETLMRTRTEISSKPNSQSDKSCKVYDTDSVPGPSWEPLGNTNFMAYNNHMNKLLLRPTSSGNVSSKTSLAEKKKVVRTQPVKSKPCLVSKQVSPTKYAGKTRKSLTPSKKATPASVKSARPISASSKTTMSGRQSKSSFVTQYDHVTRSVRDIPIDNSGPLVTKVGSKDRPSEDAFKAALRETSEVADLGKSEMESGPKTGSVKTNLETGRSNLGSKRLEDVERRGAEAIQVERVGKEYQELMKRLKQISREHPGTGKIIESAFMDDTRQNVRRSDHQRRMEEEFEKIQQDSAVLSTYPDEKQQPRESSKIKKHPIINSIDDDDDNLKENHTQIVISDESTLSQNETVIQKCSECKNAKKRSGKTKENGKKLMERCTHCNCIITNEKQERIQEKVVITSPKQNEKACEKCHHFIENIDNCTNKDTSGNTCLDCGHKVRKCSKNNEKTQRKCCHTNNVTSGNPFHDCGQRECSLSNMTENYEKNRRCHLTEKHGGRGTEIDTMQGISGGATENKDKRTSPRFSKEDVEDIMRESLKFLRAEGVMELKVGDEGNVERKSVNVDEIGHGDNIKVLPRKETARSQARGSKDVTLTQAALDSQSEGSIQSELDSETELHRLVQKEEQDQRHMRRIRDKRKTMNWDVGAVRRPRKKILKKKSSHAPPIPSKTTQCTEYFETAVGPSSTIFQSAKTTEIPLKSYNSPSKIILKTTKSASDQEFEIHIEFKKRIENLSINVGSDKKMFHADDEVSKCSVSSASTAYMKLPDEILPNSFRSNFFRCYNAYVTEIDTEKTTSDVSDLVYSNESDWETNTGNDKDMNCLDYCECGGRCKFCAKSCRKIKKAELNNGLHEEVCECEKDFLAFAQHQRFVGSNKLDLETFEIFLSELKRRVMSHDEPEKKHMGVTNDRESQRRSFLNDIYKNGIDVKDESHVKSSGSDTPVPSTSTKGLQVDGSGSEIGARASFKVNSGTETVRTVDIGVQGSPNTGDGYLQANLSRIHAKDDVIKIKSSDSQNIPMKETDNLVLGKKKVCSKAHLKSRTKNAPLKLKTNNYEQECKLERIVQGNRFPYDFNPDAINDKSKKLDPQVESYIKKLLNISREKIALMEVSSSTVATPSSSIIETPANSTVNIFQEDPVKLARLNKFFKENQELVTGLLSISEDSILLSKYDVETQIMHSNVPILKFKSKFKPSYDVNMETSSQSIMRRDRKKSKPSVLAKSRSRNLTKHFENRQVVEQKKLMRVLNSLASVRRDFESTNEKSKITESVNHRAAQPTSVPDKRSPRISTRPKTAPNLPIATVTATAKKVTGDGKTIEDNFGALSPKKAQTKISKCDVEPTSENNYKKKSPGLSIEKTQAAYERSVKEGRSFFPKDSLRINDNRVSTKIGPNSCDNVKRSGKTPRKTSPRHIQDSSPPVRDTNVVKPMQNKTSRPVKVCPNNVDSDLKSTVSAPTKKSLPIRRDSIEDVIKAAYSNQKNRDALLSLTHPELKASKQQKNNVFECKPKLRNYADLTEKCTQRLSDINRNIEEVRKNKSNIYSHLSSGDSSRSESVKSGRSSSFSIDLVKEDIHIPRPTARDTNEIIQKSPYNDNGDKIDPQNIVFTSKSSNTKRSSLDREDFVPILGDIPKPNSLDNASKCLPINNMGPKPLGSSFVGKAGGKSRPPPALSRVMSKMNPLEHIEAHELSTVVEVDSPMSVRNSSVNRTRNMLNTRSPTIFETPKLVTATKTKANSGELFKTPLNSIKGEEENNQSKISSEDKIGPLLQSSVTPNMKTDISFKKNNKDISHNDQNSEDFLKPDPKYIAKGRRSPSENNKEAKMDQKVQLKKDFESIPLSSHRNNDQDKENKFPMMEVDTFEDLMLKPFLTFEEYAKKLNLTVREASLSDTTPSNNSKGKDSNNSDGTLPDIVAELLKRNVISEPFRIDGIPYTSNIDSFDGKQTANSTTISPASSVSDLAEKSTNKGKPEKILTKSKPKSNENRSIDKQTEKSSSADLEGALKDLGMGWMLYTLRKTQESLALSSSSSSSKYGLGQSKMTSAQKLQEAKKLLTDLPPSSLGSSTDIHSILANILPDTSSMESSEEIRKDKNISTDIPLKTSEQRNNVTQTEQQTSSYFDFGNDSNAIKEFIANELANKITFSKQSVSQNSDNEHYTSLYSTRNETSHYGEAEKRDISDVHSKSSSRARSHTRRTSTPVQLYKAPAYNNSSSSSFINNSTALFSNVDDMSSVRASRCSVKNDSSSDRDGLSVPSVSLTMKSSKTQDRRNSKDSSSAGSSNSTRKK